jgi:hypothetical protein
MKYVPGTPVQGALYHRLNALIAANHSGLGPNNVNTASYAPMVGQAFQKPLSASTVQASTVPGYAHR